MMDQVRELALTLASKDAVHVGDPEPSGVVARAEVYHAFLTKGGSDTQRRLDEALAALAEERAKPKTEASGFR